MKLDPLCRMELRYTGDFHLARPYGNEAGTGWGIGDGRIVGDRLAGLTQWSNQPARRGDGTMLPNARGVITTPDGAEVLFDLTGRTVFVERDGEEVGRQLLTVLFESEDLRYAWLNGTVCVGDGLIDPVAVTARIEVFTLTSEL
jgi:Protein of unknown function (DUF3237)